MCWLRAQYNGIIDEVFFPIKKVYVKLDDAVKKIAGFAVYRKLLDKGELELVDLLITNY